jgi:hypothetical protein
LNRGASAQASGKSLVVKDNKILRIKVTST